MRASGTIAIVPMKPLADAKTRLAEELTPSQRTAVGRNLLRRVLRATRGSGTGVPVDSSVESVWVVGGGIEVESIARREGALWFDDKGSDVNETLAMSFQWALDSGKGALFLPGDLPFLKPRDLYSMVAASGHLKNITLAPARRGGGTNGILVVPGLSQPFRPLLGPNSFSRHLAQAAESGSSVAICYSPGLAFDLDTVEDLKAYEYIEPGLLDKLTSD